MKKIVLFIFTLSCLFLTGCTSSNQDSISQPSGKIILDEKEYLMIQNDFKWKENNIEINDLSSHGLEDLAEGFETLSVENGEILNFEIENTPTSIDVTQYNEDQSNHEIQIEEEQIIMPTEEGYYIYEIKVTWENGRGTYVFDVDVN